MKNKYFKTITILSIASVVGVIIILCHAYKDAVNLAKKNHSEHHLEVAQQAGRGIEKEMQSLVGQLRLLASQKAIREMDVVAAKSVLADAYEYARSHSVDDIALMDSMGIIRLPLNAPELKGKDFSFREYYRKARESEAGTAVYEHVEFKGVNPGGKGIIIAMPVFSGGGRFNGLVLFTIRVRDLLKEMLSWQEPDRVWVIDRDGNILYHPVYEAGENISNMTGGSKSFRAFIESAEGGGDHLGEYVSPKGVETIVASHAISVAGQDWEIIVSSPLDEARGIAAASSAHFGASILLLAFGAVGVFLMLKSYSSTLQDANEDLEERVAERTSELAATNEELEQEIAERTKAEEQRKRVIDAIPDLLFIIDRAGTFVDYHAPSGDDLYTAPEAVIGGNIRDLIPQIAEDTLRRIGEALDTGKPVTHSYSLEMPDGLQHYEALIGPYSATEVIAIVRNVSERRRAEEEFKEINARLQSLFDAIPGAVLFKDAEGRVLVANKGNEVIMGIKVEEMIGKTVDDFLPPEVAEQCSRSDEEVIRSGRTIRVEEYVGRKTFEAIKSPLYDDDGNYKGMVVLAFDITERKRAEEELAYSESFLKSIIDNEPECVKLVDAEGTLIDMNPSGLRMIDADSLDEVKGKNVYDLVAPEYREAFREHVESVCRGGKSMMEFRAVGLKGRGVWLETLAVPFRDPRGGRTMLLAVTRDITERKKSEEALRHSEERYRTLIDNIDVGISVISPDMEIISLNKKMQEWFPCIDISKRPICYKSFNRPAGDNVCSYCPCVKTLADGQTHSSVTDTPAGDGVRNYHVVSSPLKDTDGNVVAVIEMVEDITERARAEKALAEGRQFLENILNSIQDGLCVMDREFTIIMANPTLDRWYKQMAPAAGKKCYEVFRGRAEKCEPCECAEPVFKGGNCFRVVNYNRPDGREGTREMHGVPLYNTAGEVTGMIQYFRDITDKVTLQAEAMRAAQLASVGELAAGVAHEINNPINGIINYAQLLRSRSRGEADEGNIAERIIKEGDRISGIVRALLSFTRASGSIDLPVDIIESLGEVLSLVGAQLRKDGINIDKAIPVDLPMVMGNRQQLEQVFLNIINNSKHALNAKYPEPDEDKTLEIVGKTTKDHGATYIRLTFTDRGTGISSAMLDRVKEPFFTTKPKGVGTGLGLSISESIIDNHGGKLKIESEEGRYTSVIIDLPVDGKG